MKERQLHPAMRRRVVLGAIYRWMAYPLALCVLWVLTVKPWAPPHFTSDKYFTSQGSYTRFKRCETLLCPHAATVFHAASRAFGVASQTNPTDTRACDATFFFDNSPRAWYLKGRDSCRHPWKTSKKGVFTDAKISPKMVLHPSTFTDGDARLHAAHKKCAADPVPPNPRHLSTAATPAVFTDALSRCGPAIKTRGQQRSE